MLSYIGLNKENVHRVEEYFNYITHYTHPAAEGVAFLNELPKPLFEEVTGEDCCLLENDEAMGRRV